METSSTKKTPPVADYVFSAQYHLAGIAYVDGVTFCSHAEGRERAITHLNRAARDCDKALAALAKLRADNND